MSQLPLFLLFYGNKTWIVRCTLIISENKSLNCEIKIQFKCSFTPWWKQASIEIWPGRETKYEFCFWGSKSWFNRSSISQIWLRTSAYDLNTGGVDVSLFSHALESSLCLIESQGFLYPSVSRSPELLEESGVCYLVFLASDNVFWPMMKPTVSLNVLQSFLVFLILTGIVGAHWFGFLKWIFLLKCVAFWRQIFVVIWWNDFKQCSRVF